MELWGWVVVHGCSVQGIVHEISLTHIHYTHPKSNIEKQVPVYVAQTAERSMGQGLKRIILRFFVDTMAHGQIWTLLSKSQKIIKS